MIPIWIIGNGGHARVVMDAIRIQGQYVIAGIISDIPSEPTLDSTVSHVGPLSVELIRERIVEVAIIAIGENAVRHRIAAMLDGLVAWGTVVHPSAIVASSAVFGHGVFLGAGCIVQAGAHIGDHAIINTAASVDHDSIVSDFVHIAPGARLAGDVTVGHRSLIGMGSSVIPGICIGPDVTIGAGAAVVSHIPVGATAVGVPARVIKEREPGRPES